MANNCVPIRVDTRLVPRLAMKWCKKLDMMVPITGSDKGPSLRLNNFSSVLTKPA